MQIKIYEAVYWMKNRKAYLLPVELYPIYLNFIRGMCFSSERCIWKLLSRTNKCTFTQDKMSLRYG